MPAPAVVGWISQPGEPPVAPLKQTYVAAPDFPSTALLDDFNRADSADLGPSWLSVDGRALGQSGGRHFTIAAAQVFTLGNSGTGGAAWNNSFLADQECWTSVTTLPVAGFSVRLAVRNIAPTSADGYQLLVQPNTHVWTLQKTVAGVSTALGAVSYPIQVGDAIGLRVVGTRLRAFYQPSGDVWREVLGLDDSTYVGGGWLGFQVSEATSQLDNFGGGSISPAPITLPFRPPGAINNPISPNMRLFPSPLPFLSALPTFPVSSTFDLVYEALQAIAQTAPAAFTTPLLDDFNRADENPLSGGGNWASDRLPKTIRLLSNQATADTSLPPYDGGSYWTPLTTLADCEAYATFSVLPSGGVGGGVAARIQNVSSTSTVDGYLVVASSSGTVTIRKLTNFVASAPIATSGTGAISAGDKIGIRCIGTTIEAWVFRSGAWTKVLSATDSLYSSGAIGLWATDGVLRLDDFGGGEIGLPYEATKSLSATASDPWEAIVDGIQQTKSEAWEALLGIASTQSDAWEGLQGIAGTKSDPWDAVRALAGTKDEPWEATQKLRSLMAATFEALWAIASKTDLRREFVDDFSSLVSGRYSFADANASVTSGLLKFVVPAGQASIVNTVGSFCLGGFQWDNDGATQPDDISDGHDVALHVYHAATGMKVRLIRLGGAGTQRVELYGQSGLLFTRDGIFPKSLRLRYRFSDNSWVFDTSSTSIAENDAGIAGQAGRWITRYVEPVTGTENPFLNPGPLEIAGENNLGGTITKTMAIDDLTVWNVGPLSYEANSTLAASSTDPFEALLALSTTRSDPYEANVGLSASKSEVWEALLAVASTGSEIWEALLVLASTKSESWEALLSITSPKSDIWEALQGISSTKSEAWEAVQKLAATGLTPWEAIVGGIVASSSEPWEANLGIAAAKSEVWEALQGIAATKSEPFEALKSIAATASEILEALKPIFSTISDPWEASLGITKTTSDIYEALGGIAGTGSDIWEALGNISSPRGSPWESVLPISQTKSEPWEALLSISKNTSEPWTALQGILATGSNPYEAQGHAVVTQTASLVWEALQGLATNPPLSWEALQAITVTKIDPWEALLGISASKADPLEALKSLAVPSGKPWESLLSISGTSSESWEALVGISATKSEAWEALLGISSIPILPYEAQGKVVIIATASLPYEVVQAIEKPNAEAWESLGVITQTTSGPYEALLKLAATSPEIFEALRGIAAATSLPWDATGVVRFDVSATAVLPYDVLSGIQVIPYLPIEASINLTRTSSFPYEANIKVIKVADALTYEALVKIKNPALLPWETVIGVITKIVVLPWEAGGRLKDIVTETGLHLDGTYRPPNFEDVRTPDGVHIVVTPSGDYFLVVVSDNDYTILPLPSQLMEGLTETGLDIGET